MENFVRSDLQQGSTSWSEMEGVQGGSETSNVIRVRDDSTDEAKMLLFSLGVTRSEVITSEGQRR